MEFINLLINNFGLWLAFSLLIFFLWASTAGDPGGSDIGFTIVTIVFGIIALPVSLTILTVIGVIEMSFLIKEKKRIKKEKMSMYSKIEHEIMVWDDDGTKTAGSLTRKIMKIIQKNK